jgi:hypothetical protein
MEVPYPHTSEANVHKRQIVACSERDFHLAAEDEIPERWWLTFYKLK